VVFLFRRLCPLEIKTRGELLFFLNFCFWLPAPAFFSIAVGARILAVFLTPRMGSSTCFKLPLFFRYESLCGALEAPARCSTSRTQPRRSSLFRCFKVVVFCPRCSRRLLTGSGRSVRVEPSDRLSSVLPKEYDGSGRLRKILVSARFRSPRYALLDLHIFFLLERVYVL